MHYARFLPVIAVLLVLTFTTWNHSLDVDNCLQFTVVLASGEIIVANDAQNTDLFWALRVEEQAHGSGHKCRFRHIC
jgi:hypothetical protein